MKMFLETKTCWSFFWMLKLLWTNCKILLNSWKLHWNPKFGLIYQPNESQNLRKDVISQLWCELLDVWGNDYTSLCGSRPTEYAASCALISDAYSSVCSFSYISTVLRSYYHMLMKCNGNTTIQHFMPICLGTFRLYCYNLKIII